MTESQNHIIPLEELQQVVLPLVAIERNQHWHPIGSAFVVATMDSDRTALLLTASHNLRVAQQIESPHSSHHPTALQEFLPKPSSFVNLKTTYVHAFLPLEHKPVLTNMVRSWTYPGIDITLMLVKIPSDVEGTFPMKCNIDTRPIEEGTSVMAVGYPAMKAENMDLSEYADELEVALTLPLEYRTGSVIRVCHKGEGMYRWPGFFVNFPFDSAMSGGPVIDITGKTPTVRGLVCGDMSENSYDHKQGSGLRAFASMLWPAMFIDTQLSLVKKDGTKAPGTRLVDLVKHGFINDLGQAHLHIRRIDSATESNGSWDPQGAEDKS